MTIQVEFWQLLTFGVGLLLSFFGAVWAAGLVLAGQWKRGLDARFKAQDEARVEGSKLLRETLDKHMEDEKITRQQLIELEREFMDWRNDLPHRHGERLSRLEATVGQMPSNEDLGKIYEAINGLAETVHQLVGENRSQIDVLRMIQNMIMQKGMNNG